MTFPQQIVRFELFHFFLSVELKSRPLLVVKSLVNIIIIIFPCIQHFTRSLLFFKLIRR